MLNNNLSIHKYTGVLAFHNAGYTGKRVSAATVEDVVLSDWNGPGKVCSLYESGENEMRAHARMTASVFFEVAPDATLYTVSDRIRPSGDTYIYDLYDVMMPQMEQLGIRLLFSSISGGVGANVMERAEKFYAENDTFIPFYAAGNNGEDGANGYLSLAGSVGVAAYAVVDDAAVPESYSSVSKYVDFAAPTNVWYQPSGWRNPAMGTGTSAATPYLCGMAALVQDFFIDKTGRPLKRAALLRFFRDNCVDLETPGHDSKTGYGAVVLPDPDTIDVWAYQEKGPEGMKVENFKDAAQISEWAKEGIQKCLDAGIMDGVGDGMFNPKGAVTREQLATVAVRLMEVLA